MSTIEPSVDGKKVNIGCGTDLWGDVRLDTRKMKKLLGPGSANIYADAQYLPFKRDSFQELRAHHVLEHMPSWRLALSEWCRVAYQIDLRIPCEAHAAKAIPSELRMGFTWTLRYIRDLRIWSVQHLWQFKNRLNILSKTLAESGFTSQKWDMGRVSVFAFAHHGTKGRHVIFRGLASLRVAFDYEVIAWRFDSAIENPKS